MTDQGRVRNITDLARLAGVSPGTVSRALANSQLIAKKTRERIQQIAREHDFRPNVMARNLRIKRAGAIGILMPLGQENSHDMPDAICVGILGHLADALTERGHDMLLSRIVPDDPDWLNRVVDSGRVDGVIVIGQPERRDAIDAVASRYRPLVASDAKLASPARQDLAAEAAHLVDLLFRRISGAETRSEKGETEQIAR